MSAASALLNKTVAPPCAVIVINLQQPGCVASHDLSFLKRGQLPDSADESHRVLHAHVVGVVGAEQDVIGAEALDQVMEHAAIEGEAVEIELLQVAGRLPFYADPAIRAGAVRMVHARPVMREVAAAVRQQDLQLRETLHHPVEDEMARRDRGLERVADY